MRGTQWRIIWGISSAGGRIRAPGIVCFWNKPCEASSAIPCARSSVKKLGGGGGGVGRNNGSRRDNIHASEHHPHRYSYRHAPSRRYSGVLSSHLTVRRYHRYGVTRDEDNTTNKNLTNDWFSSSSSSFSLWRNQGRANSAVVLPRKHLMGPYGTHRQVPWTPPVSSAHPRPLSTSSSSSSCSMMDRSSRASTKTKSDLKTTKSTTTTTATTTAATAVKSSRTTDPILFRRKRRGRLYNNNNSEQHAAHLAMLRPPDGRSIRVKSVHAAHSIDVMAVLSKVFSSPQQPQHHHHHHHHHQLTVKDHNSPPEYQILGHTFGKTSVIVQLKTNNHDESHQHGATACPSPSSSSSSSSHSDGDRPDDVPHMGTTDADSPPSYKFVAVYRFGSVVFFDMTPREAGNLLERIKRFGTRSIAAGFERKEHFEVVVVPERTHHNSTTSYDHADKAPYRHAESESESDRGGIVAPSPECRPHPHPHPHPHEQEHPTLSTSNQQQTIGHPDGHLRRDNGTSPSHGTDGGTVPPQTQPHDHATAPPSPTTSTTNTENITPHVVNGDFCVVPVELDMNGVAVISNIMAQTVALDSYSDTVDELLTNFANINATVTQSGNFTELEKTVLFQVMAQNNSILIDMLSKLGIKDRSDTAWNLSQYEQVHEQLREEFEIDDRFHYMEFKLDLIHSNARFFLEILHNQKTNSLEWIIIVLITFECFLMILEMSGMGEVVFGGDGGLATAIASAFVASSDTSVATTTTTMTTTTPPANNSGNTVDAGDELIESNMENDKNSSRDWNDWFGSTTLTGTSSNNDAS